MNIEDIKSKLKTLGFPQSEINQITSIENARKIAKNLLDKAA